MPTKTKTTKKPAAGGTKKQPLASVKRKSAAKPKPLSKKAQAESEAVAKAAKLAQQKARKKVTDKARRERKKWLNDHIKMVKESGWEPGAGDGIQSDAAEVTAANSGSIGGDAERMNKMWEELESGGIGCVYPEKTRLRWYDIVVGLVIVSLLAGIMLHFAGMI